MNPKLSDDAAEMLAAIQAWHEYWDDHYDGQPLKDYEFRMLKILRRLEGK